MRKPTTDKTLDDCQAEAVILYGLAQAVDELDFLAADYRLRNPAKQNPASNALTSVNHVLIERARQLADDLDALETVQRRAKQ